MEQIICAVFDRQALAYMTPMFFQATGQAVRAFTDAVNNQENEFGKHPEDYAVFKLGSYDPGTGQIKAQPEGPIQVVTGLDVVDRSRYEEIANAGAVPINPELNKVLGSPPITANS